MAMGYRMKQAVLLAVLGLLAAHGAHGQAATDDCPCTKEYVKQCNSTGHEVATNPCVAACNGFTPQEANNWLCGELDEAMWDEYFAEWEEEDLPEAYILFSSAAPVPCESKCEGYQPVCDKFGSALADSGCLAECKGYSPADFSTDSCAPDYRDSVLCGCVGEAEQPVCDGKGTTVAANECVAACFGYTGEGFSSSNCDIQKNFSICPLIYAPVCDKKGTHFGENACEAGASYNAEEMAAFSDENCGQYVRESAACGCTEPENPVCDGFNTVVASSPCVAACAGYTDAKPCTDIFTGFVAPDPENTEIELKPSDEATAAPAVDPTVISVGNNPSEATPGPAPPLEDLEDDSKAAQLAPMVIQAVLAGVCLVAALM